MSDVHGDTYEKLVEVVLNCIQNPEMRESTGPIQPESLLVEDLGLCSYEISELELAIEREFGIDVPVYPFCHNYSVSQLLEAVNILKQEEDAD